jgi:UDP-N-acetylglucosamine diphosphorylase/glucosamine-1-phosphate N-acetyltransferase
MASHIINICIFEDAHYKSLFPLTRMIPAYDIQMGMDTLYDKISRHFSYGNMTLHCRPELKASVKERHKDTLVNHINTGSSCLFINGRLVMQNEWSHLFSLIDPENNFLFTYKGHVIALFLRTDTIKKMIPLLENTPSSASIIKHFRESCITKEVESIRLINHAVDAVYLNSDTIRDDATYKNNPGIIKGAISPFVSILNEHNTFIDAHSTIEDFVLIDARKGPVYIEENVTINAHSRLEGPLFIGKNSHILGGKIRNSSIGRNSKIGGEVSECNFQGYSNKAHDGFLGHSYIGEWVNLGAGTTTSNLKNNYSFIRNESPFGEPDTHTRFLGAIIGDYVKTGIGSMLNTGTVIDIGSTIFDAGLHAKYIPPFSWGTPCNYTTHLLDKFISTTTQMKKRREMVLTDSCKDLLQFIYKTTCKS